MNKNIIFLKPYLESKSWGSNHLQSFGIKLPNNKIGEAWMISGILNKSSYVVGGTKLDHFYRNHPQFFNNYRSPTYPLLVKLLDCKQDLSIQVHPTTKYSKTHRSVYTKNEAWWVLNAKPHASIIYGHNAKTKSELTKMVKAGSWDKLLKKVPIKKGDLFYVPSGTLHALKAGLLILEVQQASDTTFRLYDYGREKTDHTRKLTVKEAIKNITVPFTKPKIIKRNGEALTSPYFSIKPINNTGIHRYSFPQAQWLQGIVINGKGTIDGIKITKGSTFLVGNNQLSFQLNGNLLIALSYIRK